MSSIEQPKVTTVSAELPPAVTGPSVWYGPEISSRNDWIYQLTAEDVGEVERAMAPLVSAQADIAQIKRQDFELPQLGPKLRSICDDVMNGRGFALVRGLPVEQWSMRQSATAYFGIGTYFGNARSQNGKGHVLGHVRDLGRDGVNDPTARIYQTTERQTFHTDSCDVVALLCLKTAKSGGASSLASSMTIYNEMLKRRPELLPCLFEAMHTDRRGEVPTGQNPWHDIPVFNWHEGHLSALYARRYIESARRFSEISELTETQRAALNLVDELANDPAINLQMAFEPGDMQWVHNHTMMHDRTAFEDWPEIEKKRHLLRLWLAVPDARPLPEIYAQRFGKVDIGDRGGIIVPGSKMNAPLEAV
jgi:hypothetical protein